MADEGFLSTNIVEQVVEGIANVLQPNENNKKDNPIKMVNTTSQSTQIVPQLMQQIHQMQTLMSQIQNQLKNTNKNDGNYNNTSGGNKSIKLPFCR